MADKRNKEDGKRRDKDRCRSAKTKEGLRKLQDLVSQTEAVVNRLADLDDDLVTKATVIASVARQRGRQGGKSVSPRSTPSLSSQETLQETSKHETSSKNAVMLQDRENSAEVKGDNKSYTNLQAENLSNKNGASTEDDASSLKMHDNTDSQPQPERQVETNFSTVVYESKTHFADGDFSKINQPETKALENRSNSDILTQNMSKPRQNGETIDTEALSPSITTSSDEESDKIASDVTVSQQCDLTPATDKQTPDKTDDLSVTSNSGQQSTTYNGTLASSPITVISDHEEETAAKQSESTIIKIKGQDDVGDHKDPDNNLGLEAVEVCSAVVKAEGTIEENDLPETTNPQNVSPAEVDGDSLAPDGSSNQHPPKSHQSESTNTRNTNQQPSLETPTNEQSASTDPPTTNQQQLPKTPSNQHQPPKTQTKQQSKSTKAPSTNEKPTPKVTTNEQSSHKDKPEANQKPSPSNLTKKKSPSTNSLASKQNGLSKTPTKKQPSSIAALPKIQYPALKKQAQKPLTSTETQPNSKQSLTQISTKKQPTSTDTPVSNGQPPQKNIGSKLSQSTKSQAIGQQSQPEDVLTNKETASPRNLRSSFPVITYQQSPSPIGLPDKSPSPTPSNPLSPSISQESLSTTPSNQKRSTTPMTTNQQPPSPTTKVQLLSVGQSGANVKPGNQPSTGIGSSIATPSSDSSLGQPTVKEDKQRNGGPELSPAPQRHTSKAKNDVRKKLQGKLRQRRGQRV